MKKTGNIFNIACVIMITAWLSMSAFAQSLDDVNVIKISPEAGMAVVKIGGDEPRVVKAGDQLGGNGNIVEISEDRIVIETISDKGAETVIIRYKNGKQDMVRISRTGDENPALYSPVTSK